MSIVPTIAVAEPWTCSTCINGHARFPEPSNLLSLVSSASIPALTFVPHKLLPFVAIAFARPGSVKIRDFQTRSDLQHYAASRHQCNGSVGNQSHALCSGMKHKCVFGLSLPSCFDYGKPVKSSRFQSLETARQGSLPLARAMSRIVSTLACE